MAGCFLIAGGSILTRASRPAVEERSTAAEASGPAADGPDWRALLNQLGRQRSSIWQRSRPAELGRVFAPGSSVLRRDRQSLLAYAARGVRVDGATVVFGPVESAITAQRSVTLVVVDRLEEVVASVERAGSRSLPRDEPTRHEVVLRQTTAGWRISAIRAVGR